MNTPEQQLSESLLAACKAAGIEKPKYITQDCDGTIYHNPYRKPKVLDKLIWSYDDSTKEIDHPPYAADWQESLLEWVEPQEIQLPTVFIPHEGEPLADVLARHPDHVADGSKMIDRYTVEPHGKGYAICLGRDNKHHGANLAHLSECSPAFADQIQALLNGKYTPQANNASDDDACKIAYRKRLNDDTMPSSNANIYQQAWSDALAWKAMAEKGGEKL